jgi:hypothetical protein
VEVILDLSTLCNFQRGFGRTTCLNVGVLVAECVDSAIVWELAVPISF